MNVDWRVCLATILVVVILVMVILRMRINDPDVLADKVVERILQKKRARDKEPEEDPGW